MLKEELHQQQQNGINNLLSVPNLISVNSQVVMMKKLNLEVTGSLLIASDIGCLSIAN